MLPPTDRCRLDSGKPHSFGPNPYFTYGIKTKPPELLDRQNSAVNHNSREPSTDALALLSRLSRGAP